MLSIVLRKAADRSPHLEILVQDVPTPMQPAALHDARFDIGLSLETAVRKFNSASWAVLRWQIIVSFVVRAEQLHKAFLEIDHSGFLVHRCHRRSPEYTDMPASQELDLPALAPYSDRLFPAVAIAFPIRPVLRSVFLDYLTWLKA